MAVRALPGVGADLLLEVLRESATRLFNVRGAAGAPTDRLTAYQRWANEEVWRLGRLIPASEIDRLVTTPRYWALQSLDASSHGNLAGFVDVELEERLRAFENEVEELRRTTDRWSVRTGVLVVADTNVYLHHRDVFDNIAWRDLTDAGMEGLHLVIPLLVVDELDRQKRSARSVWSGESKQEVRTRARQTLRLLDELFADPVSTVALQPAKTPCGAVTASLLIDPPHHVRLSSADSELIDQARSLQDLTGRSVCVMTFDTGMAFRARAAGLQVIRPPNE